MYTYSNFRNALWQFIITYLEIGAIWVIYLEVYYLYCIWSDALQSYFYVNS